MGTDTTEQQQRTT